MFTVTSVYVVTSAVSMCEVTLTTQVSSSTHTSMSVLLQVMLPTSQLINLMAA